MADNNISRWSIDTSKPNPDNNTTRNNSVNEGTTLQTCFEREVLGRVKACDHDNQDLYNYTIGIMKLPRFEYATGMDGYIGEDKYHDAGWDAYCTGCLFAVQLSLMHNIHSDSLIIAPEPDVMVVVEEEDGECVDDAPSTTKRNQVLSINQYITDTYSNKLFMMRSMYHMSIAPPADGTEGGTGGDAGGVIKYKGGLFYLSGFAPKTNTSEISNILTNSCTATTSAAIAAVLGSESEPVPDYTLNDVYVSWVDDYGVFVHVEHLNESDSVKCSTDIANGFINRAGSEWPENWTIIPAIDYLEHKDRFLNGVLKPAVPVPVSVSVDVPVEVEKEDIQPPSIGRSISDTISTIFSMMSGDTHTHTDSNTTDVDAPPTKKVKVNE